MIKPKSKPRAAAIPPERKELKRMYIYKAYSAGVLIAESHSRKILAEELKKLNKENSFDWVITKELLKTKRSENNENI